MNILRIYWLEVRNIRTGEIITVELWAHHRNEAIERTKPFAAKELGCEIGELEFLPDNPLE